MEDFLKDRPILSEQEAVGSAPANGASTPGHHAAFAQIRREMPRAATSNHAPAQVVADVQHLTGEHGTRVQTVVERGRVTKIIVTCACGKTTEIACSY